MRVGKKNGLVYQWAKRGRRPRRLRDQPTLWERRSVRLSPSEPRYQDRPGLPVPVLLPIVEIIKCGLVHGFGRRHNPILVAVFHSLAYLLGSILAAPDVDI